MAIEQRDIAGLILIGGHSKRMGSPKAFAAFAGIPLWQHAVNSLTPHVNETFLLGNVPDHSLTPHCRKLEDAVTDMGPLGGLLAGLEHSGYMHHLLLAVDYPLVSPRLLERLKSPPKSCLAVCGHTSESVEPLVAYYHRDCAPAIRSMLDEGETRCHRLLERVLSNVIDSDEIAKIDPANWSYFNVNTPADLIEAETRLRSGYPT